MRKKRAFGEGDSELLRSRQKHLKVKIRDNKKVYRRKLENKLQLNNICCVVRDEEERRLQAERGSDGWNE